MAASSSSHSHHSHHNHQDHHNQHNHHHGHHHGHHHRHHHNHDHCSNSSSSSNHHHSHNHQIVMIAMDGSEHSYHAFDWYMRHLHSRDTEVIVAHSSPHSSAPFLHLQNLMPSLTPSDTTALAYKMKAEEEEVNSIVANIKGVLTQSGVHGRLILLQGEPGAAIVHAALENNVSCIVTGCRGLGKVKRALVGSVSDYILHHAHCPVLICRHKDFAKS